MTYRGVVRRGAARRALFAALLVALATRARAADFVVITTADNGDPRPGDGICGSRTVPCSLRAAISECNANGTADHIFFDIPGPPPYVINLTGPLPDVSEPQHLDTIIDGTSQPGYAGQPLVVIDGSALAVEPCLKITNGHATVEGLDIRNCGAQGIAIVGGHINVIQRNYIGTDESGTRGMPNRGEGIVIQGSNLNTIGGAGFGNLISANLGDAVSISGAVSTDNVIAGNRIGTDVTGSFALANDGSGVLIDGASKCIVGGSDAAAGNLISGNSVHGVVVRGATASGNLIAGNLIGTDATAARALGNTRGIQITDAPDTSVGAPGGAGFNVISGNAEDGIWLQGAAATAARILGNRIGTRGDGTAAIPNGGSGMVVDAGASGALIGGPNPGDGNLVAHNAGAGIAVRSGTGNRLQRNRIFANGGLGIDLGSDLAPTPDDAGDADSGPNQLQNFPALAAAVSDCGSVRIDGVLDSAPAATFEIELFASAACDPSGYGEAERFLGSTTGTTDATGTWRFTAVVPLAIAARDAVTATATDAAGNTSELSACVIATRTCGCGNGVVDAGEDCDEGGGDSPTCDSDCTSPRCGDGHLNTAAAEQCDDGNTLSGDGCSATCQIESCLVGKLSAVALLRGARTAPCAARFSWNADAAAAGYHLNSVLAKTLLLAPQRSAGAAAACDTSLSATACVDADTCRAPQLFYQALSACGPADEGPF